MQAAFPATGRGMRLRPLTENKRMETLDASETSISTHCSAPCVKLGAELVGIVVCDKTDIIINGRDECNGLLITYASLSNQRSRGIEFGYLGEQDWREAARRYTCSVNR